MLESVLQQVTGTMSIQTALLCTLVSLVLGLVIAASYMLQGNYSKSYVITLAVLPSLVQAVIMLVNGNLGTGVAIVGAFSLVRFRSFPGSAREIAGVFFAMIVGLANGMGYLTYGVLLTVVVAVFTLALYRSGFGGRLDNKRNLKVVIPEDLDYEEVFDEILTKYTASAELIKVRTINLGSMYEISYRIQLKKDISMKQMMDEIRVRNGNLQVSCSKEIQDEAM